jgi:hypothetical protein
MRSHLVAVGVFLVALPAFAQDVKLPGEIDPGAKPTVYELTPISSIRKGAVIALKPSLFVDVNGEATRVLNPRDSNIAPKSVLGSLYEANPEIHAYCSHPPIPGKTEEFRSTLDECDRSKYPNCLDGVPSTPLTYFEETRTYPWYADFKQAKIARSNLYHACYKRVAKLKNFPGKSRVLKVLDQVIVANNTAKYCGIELEIPGLSPSTGRIRFQPEVDVTLADRPIKAGKAVIFSAVMAEKAPGGQIKTLTCFNTKTVADIQHLFKLPEPPAHDPYEIEFGANPPASKSGEVSRNPAVSAKTKKELATDPTQTKREAVTDVRGGGSTDATKTSGSIDKAPGEF